MAISQKVHQKVQTYEEKCRVHDRGVEAEVASVLKRLTRLVEKRAGERYEEQPAY